MVPGTAPLESGDRLTREEFERRFTARPDIKKAELIEGVVYVPSPARFRHHSEPQAFVLGWLTAYAARTPGVLVGGDGTVRLDDANEPMPDAFLAWEPGHGGQARIDDDDYISGAPELIVEVAASSASYDLHDKLNAYLRNGVCEYIVWRTFDAALDWFRLEDGSYVRVEPGKGGIIESEAFPGLRLNVPALLRGDLAGVLAPQD